MHGELAVSGVCYSVSQLKLFEQCPLRYRYYYIERIKSIIQSIESFVGIRVHETLEHLYTCLREGILLPVGDVLTHYRRRWESKWHRSIQFSNPQHNREWYRRYGEKCVRHYYMRFYPFDQLEETTVDVEWFFEIFLDPDKHYRMRGHVDRISCTQEGFFTVHDYKTSRFVPRLKHLVHDPQPGVYQLAVQHAFPEAQAIKASWHYLARRRELHPTLSPTQLEQLRCLLIKKIDQIEYTSEFAPRPSPACKGCQYQQDCGAFEEYQAKQLTGSVA